MSSKRRKISYSNKKTYIPNDLLLIMFEYTTNALHLASPCQYEAIMSHRKVSSSLCTLAMRPDSPEWLKQAHTNGKHGFQRLVNSKSGTFVDTCEMAVKRQSLICLEYAHTHGEQLCDYLFNTAAWYGAFECFLYVYHYKGSNCWTENTCDAAAYGGNLDCLRFLHENGCPWDDQTTLSAAQRGHIDCLQYAHQNGCPFHINICIEAAAAGQLECLQYAHENGATWNEATCESAAWFGHIECLRYAHENGCLWDKSTCERADEEGETMCLIYARANGCPG